MDANGNIKMYDYILEERKVLKNLLNNRKNIAAGFAAYLMNNPVDEIVISGSGTSYHAAAATRLFLENLLQIRVRAEYPMILKDSQSFYGKNNLLLAISQGGQSQSTIDVVNKAHKESITVAAISENKNAAVFENASIKILMEIGPELSVAKTKGYVGTVLILFLLGIEAALVMSTITEEEYYGYIKRLDKVICHYDILVPQATEWVEKVRNELALAKRIIVLGYKENYANVLEGALKLLETLRYGVYGYDIEEFFHGIYNSIDKDTYIIYLTQDGEYANKVKLLYSVMKEITEHQFVISSGIDGYVPSPKDCILPFTEDYVFSVLEYILPLQIISAIIPYDLGINPFIASDPKFHSKVKSKNV